MRRKIVITTGTRAEYGILRPIIRSILQSKKLKLYLIVTGTHLSKEHGYTINEIKKDGYKIFKTIQMIPTNDTGYSMAKTLGQGIIEFSKIFSKIKPDINVVLGDRDEMMASAIAAYHMNIPVAHIHGGDRSGGIDEYTRHAITKISNIHFAATKNSFDRIIKLGENPKYVFLTGSPVVDEISSNMMSTKQDLEKQYNLQIHGDEILLLYHPVTTEIQYTEKYIRDILMAIVRLKKFTIAIAPNSDAGGKKIFLHIKKYAKKYDFIRLYPSVPRKDFLGLLNNCGVLVGNSSSGIIEASYFQIPVVNIGNRQDGREKGANTIDVKDVSVNNILNAIVLALKTKKSIKTSKTPYGDGTASQKIVKHLEQLSLNPNLIKKQISY